MDEKDIAGFYMDRFYGLDNFSAFAIEEDYGRGNTLRFMTAEHRYQHAKFLLTEEELEMLDENRNWPFDVQYKILDAKSAHDAKQIARENKDLVTKRWDEIKLGVMKETLLLKFHQFPYIQRTLERTQGLAVVETSPIDSFWGWGPDKTGQNHLGKLWMEIRLEHLNIPIVEWNPV